jgi:hypothetical protein
MWLCDVMFTSLDLVTCNLKSCLLPKIDMLGNIHVGTMYVSVIPYCKWLSSLTPPSPPPPPPSPLSPPHRLLMFMEIFWVLVPCCTGTVLIQYYVNCPLVLTFRVMYRTLFSVYVYSLQFFHDGNTAFDKSVKGTQE